MMQAVMAIPTYNDCMAVYDGSASPIMAPTLLPTQKKAMTGIACPVAVRRRGIKWRMYKINVTHVMLSVMGSMAAIISAHHGFSISASPVYRKMYTVKAIIRMFECPQMSTTRSEFQSSSIAGKARTVR